MGEDMHRTRFATGVLGSLLAGGVAALAASPARALQIENGDVVGIFVKNGNELIVNLGPFEAGTVDLGNLFNGAGFEGTPAGSKFVALAVEDPGRMVNVPGFGQFPQENIVYSTLATDPMPTDSQIELSMKSVDAAQPGAVVWFNLLRAFPGSDSEALPSTNTSSYESVLGLGTDAIGNNMSFSTAGEVDGQGQLTISVYSDVRGYADFGGPDTEHLTLGQLEIDGNEVTFVAPEAAAVLRVGAGLAVLAVASLLRRRSAPV
jgi:hypothetical protein